MNLCCVAYSLRGAAFGQFGERPGQCLQGATGLFGIHAENVNLVRTVLHGTNKNNVGAWGIGAYSIGGACTDAWLELKNRHIFPVHSKGCARRTTRQWIGWRGRRSN